MLAGHSSFLVGRSYAWLILVALMLGGAAARLFFNLRHVGRTVWAIPAVLTVAAAALAIGLHDDPGGVAAGPPVAFARVGPVIAERCAPCHAAAPTHAGYSAPPAGIVLETPAQIAARAGAIAAVVSARVMPLGNATGMTDAERKLVAAWVAQGADTASSGASAAGP